MLFIPPEIESILSVLAQNGYEAYLVGGCVRDMLLGLTPHDYDITTSAPPEAVLSLFEKTVPTGLKHGTVTVVQGGCAVEVTTYRTDGAYSDHRRPASVTFVKSLREDLARRDFTVNAIAYNHTDGLQDFFGGAEDLSRKLLRAVGEPKRRFREDALRILRLFRFAAALGFAIEPATQNAALALAPDLRKISVERILVELHRALNGKNPAALEPLIRAGGLGFIGLRGEPCYEKIPPLQKSGLALFAFLYSSGADIPAALSLLKVSNREKKQAEQLLALLSMPFPTDKADLKEMLFKTDPDAVEKYLVFKKQYDGTDVQAMKSALREILTAREPYRLSDLAIGGSDCIKCGITGEKIGEALETLRQFVVKKPACNRRAILLEELKKHR